MTFGRNGQNSGGKFSMVGATFPTAPSVRIAKSRQFSITEMQDVTRSFYSAQGAGTWRLGEVYMYDALTTH